MSLEQLLNDSGSLEKLQQKMEADNSKKSYKDERFWYPVRDKAGIGSAVIRFLPVKPDDAVTDKQGNTVSVNGIPWVQTYSHSYKNETNGKWYIEECPTTIGGTCPMCEANSELWNTGTEANKNLVRSRKRRLSYVVNILVVSDKATPENEGKVFLFKFGKKIYDIIDGAMNPEFDDVAPIEVFDFLKGADFHMRIKKVDGWANYDSSSFGDSSPLYDGDIEKIKPVYNSLYALSEFISPDRFKTYEELNKRLALVLGTAATSTPTTIADAGDLGFLKDHLQTAVAETPVATTSLDDVMANSGIDDIPDASADEDFFKQLESN